MGLAAIPCLRVGRSRTAAPAPPRMDFVAPRMDFDFVARASRGSPSGCRCQTHERSPACAHTYTQPRTQTRKEMRVHPHAHTHAEASADAPRFFRVSISHNQRVGCLKDKPWRIAGRSSTRDDRGSRLRFNTVGRAAKGCASTTLPSAQSANHGQSARVQCSTCMAEHHMRR